MPTAILVDGDFFIKRFRRRYGDRSPEQLADQLHRYCLNHLNQKDSQKTLYRIFFYDCPPSSKKIQNPKSGVQTNLAVTPTADYRNRLHEALRKQRKLALRLGYLPDNEGKWVIKERAAKKLLQDRINTADIDSENDLEYVMIQKGVDMRIGIDVASVTLKGQADQIILVSGDSDFVPAAKLARREGVDFLLDSMGATPRPDLKEHIDGMSASHPHPPRSGQD